MQGNKTFTIIKPDSVENGYIGAILDKIAKAGFNIKAMKMVQLTLTDTERFYSIHKGKAFWDELVEFMTRGPIVVAVLEKENAVEDFRKLLGATNPANAEEGTLRQLYGKDLTENAVHGSDSDENAKIESGFFFAAREIF